MFKNPDDCENNDKNEDKIIFIVEMTKLIKVICKDDAESENKDKTASDNDYLNRHSSDNDSLIYFQISLT